MVISTSKELIFKGSKKQHQILAQTAYYQAGKIVIQTILPEQPPVALIILNTLGTTCSTSADTYIPIENISNTQSCSFLESRLVSLYGGKAASLLMEYQQRLSLYLSLYVYPAPQRPPSKTKGFDRVSSLRETDPSDRPKGSAEQEEIGLAKEKVSKKPEGLRSWDTSRGREVLHSFGYVLNIEDVSKEGISKTSKENFEGTEVKGSISISSSFADPFGVSEGSVSRKLETLSKPSEKVGFTNDFVDTTSIYANKEPISYFNKLINNVQSWVLDPSKFTPLQTGFTIGEAKGLSLAYGKTRLAKTYFAGAGNNIFQSTLGNIEIQTATRLASIMVNYWNFYSLNKNTALMGFASEGMANPLQIPRRGQQRKTLSTCEAKKGSSKAILKEDASFSKVQQLNELNSLSINFVNNNKLVNDVLCIPKGSSKAVPSLLRKPKGLAELRRKGGFALIGFALANPFRTQSRGLDKVVSSKPLSLPALQAHYSAFLTSSMLAKQSVGVKTRKDLLSKGFEKTAEGYKPQAAPDSSQRLQIFDLYSKNFVNRSVKDKPLLSNLFIPKKSKALRFCSAKAIPLLSFAYPKGLAKMSKKSGVEKQGFAKLRKPFGVTEGIKQSILPIPTESIDYVNKSTFHYDKYNVKVLGIKLKVKDKTPKGFFLQSVALRNKALHFAITQSKNSLKICENKNFSYNIRRLSVENIGGYSQLNHNNFQLINSLQFSNLQRDSFYPNWFRLYLPDIEATEFLKNVANYYFSLGLQTFTLPSTKLDPFSTFLNKHTLNPRGFYSSSSLLRRSRNISYYNFLTSFNREPFRAPPSLTSRCEAKDKMLAKCEKVGSLGDWVSTARPQRAFTAEEYQHSTGIAEESIMSDSSINEVNKSVKALWGTRDLQSWELVAEKQRRGLLKLKVKDSSCTKIVKDQLDPLNTPFSLLVENKIFPLNYNDFSIVEKELLYDALVNSCFVKAFYLINQNRQLLDFLVDYLLRFQILRQHQILYLFSTLLVGCTKSHISR